MVRFLKFPKFQVNPVVSERLAGAVGTTHPFTPFRAGSGEQEGESGTFRAPKGEKFPACEPRMGYCGSVGAKGQRGSPDEIEVSPIFKYL